MAVTAAEARKEPIYVDVGQNNFWQVWAGMESNSFVVRTTRVADHSTGTTNSLRRTMLSLARAANSIARGSFLSRSTSVLCDLLMLRNDSTSFCICENWSEANKTLDLLLFFTVLQKAYLS